MGGRQRFSALGLFLSGQQPQEIRQPKNLDTVILNERQQLTVACDDEFRVRFYGAFENTVVRFIAYHLEASAARDDSGDMADCLYQCPGFFLRPFKFVLENSGRLSEDGHRGEEFESTVNRAEVRVFCLATWNGEGRHIDVGVEDHPHGQRS